MRALKDLELILPKEVVLLVVATFQNDAPEVLDRIKDSCKKKDFTTLHRDAHSLKSMAANMGFDHLTHVARTVEELAKQESPAIESYLEGLDKSLQEALMDLNTYWRLQDKA